MDHPNCLCKPYLPDDLCAPDVEPTSWQVLLFKHFESTVVFEAAIAGTTTRKTFRILNEHKAAVSYIARRDPRINPIYHAFDFKIVRNVVASGDYLECIVTYSPHVPNESNVDYFEIVDTELKVYKVCLKGNCIGPNVNISVKALYFYKTQQNQLLTNTFEIQNLANVPATFQLDITEEAANQKIFKMDKVRGTIQPFKHTYVTVKFAANSDGVYSQHVFCLVMHQAPIRIEFIGVHSTTLECHLSAASLKKFSQKIDEINGFTGYMYDSVKVATKKPPLSLTTSYLDFGRVEYQKNAKNSRTLVTSLTNHLKENVEIKWFNDNKGVFSITPRKIIVPPSESVLCECQFQPDLADQLYSEMLTACAHWSVLNKKLKAATVVELIEVPLNVSLKVLGHSFPENKEWLPRVEINPNVVILPPCVPLLPTYTTLLLRAFGHLPTSFKFVPPNKTNFLLKPMVGVIHQFQIVVVQLQPDANNKKAYVERWGLQLNGRTEDCMPFYVKGFSEYASLSIGVGNVVVFSTVHPNCEDISNVVIKNTSVHYLRYSFKLDKHNYFSIDHPEGQIAPNENIILQWRYTGNLNAPQVSIIPCEVYAVQHVKIIIGAPVDVFVTVYTKCEYSELCATPSEHCFDEIEWGTTESKTFYLFNFGKSPIHFKLLPKNTSSAGKQVTIVPGTGTVKPREKIKIIVHVKATQTGHQKITILYQVRLNEVSDAIIDDKKGYDIFFLRFCCVYPTLQIADICATNFGFLFSRVVLWDIFNIDELNAVLQKIEHDETKSVELFLPDYEMSQTDFFTLLLVRNITRFREEINLVRKQLCNCKLVMKSKGISLRQRVYDCIHRDMFKMSLSNMAVEAQLTEILKMETKYLEYGSTRMLYTLNLSHNRKVNLYVNINVLPKQVTAASKYFHSYNFELNSVFIGEKNPQAQAFPLYNNSAFVINYELDITSLSELNFNYGFDILQCLNPKGTLPPYTSKDVLFQFVPIEARTYRVTAALIMGQNQFVLNISGTGILTPNYLPASLCTLPCSSQYSKNPIDFSYHHLIVPPFPVWSTSEEMLFIRNQTTDRIIGYCWQPSSVEGIVEAEAVYRKGILQPKESHSVIIRINSFNQPCHVRLQMVCKLLDHSQHILHEQSVAAYNRKQEELRGQFVITENGTYYPKNDVVIHPDAEYFFATLALNVCITSMADRDLYMDAEAQLKQSSQYSLHINIANIFKEYFKPLLPKRSLFCLQALKNIDKISDQKNQKVQQKCCSVTLNQHNVKVFKNIVECLIADAVLSNIFSEVIKVANNAPQPYYIQFKTDDSNPDDKQFQNGLEKHMELVDNFLNKPQAPVLANVLKELIADSIHEIFQLGPQIKNRPDKQNAYYASKSKMPCPVCMCKH